MDQLIEALQIFRKYGNEPFPTGCEHDTLYVYIDPTTVSADDRAALEKLGFDVDEDIECFSSYRFGSS